MDACMYVCMYKPMCDVFVKSYAKSVCLYEQFCFRDKCIYYLWYE